MGTSTWSLGQQDTEAVAGSEGESLGFAVSKEVKFQLLRALPTWYQLLDLS